MDNSAVSPDYLVWVARTGISAWQLVTQFCSGGLLTRTFCQGTPQSKDLISPHQSQECNDNDPILGQGLGLQYGVVL